MNSHAQNEISHDFFIVHSLFPDHAKPVNRKKLHDNQCCVFFHIKIFSLPLKCSIKKIYWIKIYDSMTYICSRAGAAQHGNHCLKSSFILYKKRIIKSWTTVNGSEKSAAKLDRNFSPFFSFFLFKFSGSINISLDGFLLLLMLSSGNEWMNEWEQNWEAVRSRNHKPKILYFSKWSLYVQGNFYLWSFYCKLLWFFMRTF